MIMLKIKELLKGTLLGCTWGIIAEYVGIIFLYYQLYSSSNLFLKIILLPAWIAIKIHLWLQNYMNIPEFILLPLLSVLIGALIGTGIYYIVCSLGLHKSISNS